MASMALVSVSPSVCLSDHVHPPVVHARNHVTCNFQWDGIDVPERERRQNLGNLTLRALLHSVPVGAY